MTGVKWHGVHVQEYGKVENLFADIAMNHRQRLGEILRQKSLVIGDVVLSSGQKSKYYLDCKLTTLAPEGAFLTGYAVLELLDSMCVQPEAIGGLSMGADPIVSATVVVSHLEKRPLPGFLIRKERKKHGRHKQIEGIDGPIRDVVIVDEVCTTGASTQEAIDIAEAEGYQVIAVISLIDREEGGSEELRRKYHYRAIFTARELMEHGQFSGSTCDATQSVGSRPSVNR